MTKRSVECAEGFQSLQSRRAFTSLQEGESDIESIEDSLGSKQVGSLMTNLFLSGRRVFNPFNQGGKVLCLLFLSSLKTI